MIRTRSETFFHSRWNYLFIGIVALLLRIFDLDRFVHTDEINFWIDRSSRFLGAIQTGDFAATAISTHPGVTTMWLGSIGTFMRRTLFEQGILTNETFPTILTLMRLPVALVHVGGILLGYMLLRRLFSPSIAFLAALLWATDPFVTAFNRILHVDGLTGTFATLSILSACLYWNNSQQNKWLIFSGATATLAMFSKSPGMAVLPIVLMLGVWHIVQPIALNNTQDTRMERTLATIRSLLLWGIVAAITGLLIWPALWADPQRVYHLLRVGVEVEGGTKHMIVNYFLGQQDPVPGPLYYAVVLAIRMTPWAMVGVLLLPLAMRQPTIANHPHRATARTIAILAAFIILFVTAMSFFPKKLDRYLVVTFPIVNILAAVGIIGGIAYILAWVTKQGRKKIPERATVSLSLTALITIIAIVNAAWWHPYGVSYFNQALGGIKMGVHTVLIGEGEALGDAAAWLNEQPDITGVTTASTMIHTLQAFLRKGAQSVSPKGGTFEAATGYVLIYIRHMQRWGNNPPPPYDQYYLRVAPTHVVKVHGIDYVNIYQVPRSLTHTANVDFGEAIRLHSYDVDATHIRSSGTLSLTLQWKARKPIAEDALLFVHVFDEKGQKVAQIDVPPAGLHRPISQWETNRYLTWVHPIPLPPNIAAGTYDIALGLYDPKDFQRIPLTTPLDQSDKPDDGSGAFFLEPIVIPEN